MLLNQVGLEGTYLNMTKALCDKPTAYRHGNLLWHIEVKKLSEGHTLANWQRQDGNPVRVAPESPQNATQWSPIAWQTREHGF